jgi:hypothetical protein
MKGLERKKYTGDMRNGVPHGQGICEFANGDRYVGEFRNGECHGCGILTFAEGGRAAAESRPASEGRQAAPEFEKWMATIFIEN